MGGEVRTNLLEARFQRELCIREIKSSPEERLILFQLGFFPGERLQKLHSAPWGDPITLRIDSHSFSLRKELCSRIFVEEA